METHPLAAYRKAWPRVQRVLHQCRVITEDVPLTKARLRLLEATVVLARSSRDGDQRAAKM